MAVVLADLLEENQVKLELAAETRDQALRELVGLLRGPGKVSNAESFLGEVMAREAVRTTFLGHGAAFPHARTTLVSELVLAIGRSGAGIPYGEKGERAHLIFLLGVPVRMASDYLVCVGALARLVSDGKTREVLLQATTAAELIELLRKGSLVLE